MSRHGVNILLRDLVREAIGLEDMLWEWGVLDEEPIVMMEDPYSRQVDRMTPTTMEPNISDLKLKAIDRPSAAKADIDAALEKGEGSYEKAVQYLDKEPGQPQIKSRTLRRIDYQLKGGAEKALTYKDEFAGSGTKEEKDKKKRMMRGLKRAHKGAKAGKKYT